MLKVHAPNDPLSKTERGGRGGKQVVVVVVAFSSLARILGECSTIHSPPALLSFFFFFFFGKWRLARAH